MILIDTDVFIDNLRNYAPSIKFFESLIGRNDILFSSITEAELLAGKINDNPEKREKLLHLLHYWNKIPADNPIAELAGDICRKYNLTIPDAIIAASAILNNAELITKNARDFQKISGLKSQTPY
ncbi:MAG: type II toxin-antitoxin system VapC family toxin [Nanoarchaeota archaeon]